MFRLKPIRSSDIGNNEFQSMSMTSMNSPPIMKAKNVKSWVYNTNLKYAIGDLRSQLISEAKNTNATMKQKIQDWVTRDYMEAANHISTKDTPVAKENEAMRQLISDLINGPIASLLNSDARNKLCRLSIPALPTTGIFLYEDTNMDNRLLLPLRPGSSYYSSSFTNTVHNSGETGMDWHGFNEEEDNLDFNDQFDDEYTEENGVERPFDDDGF